MRASHLSASGDCACCWASRRVDPDERALLGYGLFFLSLLLDGVRFVVLSLGAGQRPPGMGSLPIALACAGLLVAVRAESKPKHE